jgi:hypothetical protein
MADPNQGIPMKNFTLLIGVAALSGCGVTSTNTKTLVIAPSDKPVTVTAYSETHCYKYPFLRCTSHQKLEGSNGQVDSDFPKD